MIALFVENFWQLLVGHALADFALQSDVMAKGKNRHVPVDLSKIPPGQKPMMVWPYWLVSHALIHGGVVAYITSNYYLGMAEAACHLVIDVLKCENITNIHVDQALHVACKAVWAFIYVQTMWS